MRQQIRSWILDPRFWLKKKLFSIQPPGSSILVLLLLTSIWHPASSLRLFAAPNAGTAGAQFLNLGVSARSIAMGNAYSAVSFGGVVAAHYNPAGISGMKQSEVSFMYYRYVLDSHFSYLGVAHPLGKNARAILAANVIYGTVGSVEETQVAVGEDSGVKTGKNFSASDAVGAFSFAFSATKKLGIGVNFKYIVQELGAVRSNAPAGDFGLLYRMGPKLSLGLAARNIGPDLKFERVPVPLPFSYVLGINYSLFKNDLVLFAADFEKPRNQNMAIRFGGELNLGPSADSGKIGTVPKNRDSPHFSIRAGHDGLKRAGSGLSFGAGLRLGNYALDYAFVPFGQLGEVHRISATVRFGKPRN